MSQEDARTIRLTVPAETRSLEVVRATTVTTSSGVITDWDSLEDLRLAVDELCAILVETGGGPGRTLEVTLWPQDGAVAVEGRLDVDDGVEPPVVSEVARILLEGSVDGYGLTHGPGRLGFHLRKQGC